VLEHTFAKAWDLPNVADHQAMCPVVVGGSPVKLKTSLKRRYRGCRSVAVRGRKHFARLIDEPGPRIRSRELEPVRKVFINPNLQRVVARVRAARAVSPDSQERESPHRRRTRIDDRIEILGDEKFSAKRQ